MSEKIELVVEKAEEPVAYSLVLDSMPDRSIERVEVDFEARKILGRKLLTDYIMLETLARLTGETPDNFDKLIVKELMESTFFQISR